MPTPLPTVFIPALLCDEGLYREVIGSFGGLIEPHVLISPKPSLADSAADVLARAPERFVLVGTSYGGLLALEIALAAPERVTALWLMGCDPGPPRQGGPDLAAGLEATPDAVIDLLAGLVVHKDATGAGAAFRAMAQRLGGTAGAAQARAVAARSDFSARLGELTLPALVLWGHDDALVPVDVGRRLAAALPQARFHEIEACGHLPTLEKPADSAALAADFLRGLADRSH